MLAGAEKPMPCDATLTPLLQGLGGMGAPELNSVSALRLVRVAPPCDSFTWLELLQMKWTVLVGISHIGDEFIIVSRSNQLL